MYRVQQLRHKNSDTFTSMHLFEHARTLIARIQGDTKTTTHVSATAIYICRHQIQFIRPTHYNLIKCNTWSHHTLYLFTPKGNHQGHRQGVSPMKGKFQTKARPGLKFTQPRRIPQLLTTGFFPPFFHFFFSCLCLYFPHV